MFMFWCFWNKQLRVQSYIVSSDLLIYIPVETVLMDPASFPKSLILNTKTKHHRVSDISTVKRWVIRFKFWLCLSSSNDKKIQQSAIYMTRNFQLLIYMKIVINIAALFPLLISKKRLGIRLLCSLCIHQSMSSTC